MKKISTVFLINRETDLATMGVAEQHEWVLNGEGFATVKFDGTAVTFLNGRWYKRFDRKLNKQAQKRFNKWKSGYDKHAFVPTEADFRVLPEGAIPNQPEPDPITFHHPHWVPADLNAPENKQLAEAVLVMIQAQIAPIDGASYELIGPDIQRNPHSLSRHQLVRHGAEVIHELNTPTRDFHQIKAWLESNHGEGLVFHHPDGRMAKIRRKDMGFEWNPEADPRNRA